LAGGAGLEDAVAFGFGSSLSRRNPFKQAHLDG